MIVRLLESRLPPVELATFDKVFFDRVPTKALAAFFRIGYVSGVLHKRRELAARHRHDGEVEIRSQGHLVLGLVAKLARLAFLRAHGELLPFGRNAHELQAGNVLEVISRSLASGCAFAAQPSKSRTPRSQQKPSTLPTPIGQAAGGHC